MSGILGIALVSGEPDTSIAKTEKEEKMTYSAKDYNRLIGMEGFQRHSFEKPFYPLSGICDQYQ